jgi:oligo-alginate lyase
MKVRSTFFSEKNLKRFRNNSVGTEAKQYFLDGAKKWDDMSDDELWELMFNSDLKRAHQILTNGWCPDCREVVAYYNWKKNAFTDPWKVICPHCGARFPKNDFKKYYESGLDEHHEFRHSLADKSLLFNTDAPDPNDPKHKFGIDDGNGCIEGDTKWMFIATYLLNSVWNEQIVDGIKTLSRAFALTGEKRYARKCGIILDRVADLFPEFDYYEQGMMYEEVYSSRGYIGYWCEVVRQLQFMLFAYDAIFETIREDEEFISFITEKSEKYKTPYRKSKFRDIQYNIESRIFKDAVTEKWKIAANYPWPENYIIFAKMVLSRWPAKKEDMNDGVYKVMWWSIEPEIKSVIEKTTFANGLSGEKGFTGYSRIALDELGRLICFLNMYDENFISNIMKQYPQIQEGINFYMNAWLICMFYPGCGDSGGGGSYVSKGIPFQTGHDMFKAFDGTLLYSFDSFLWRIYKITGNINILRYMYNSESFKTEELFTSDFTLEAKPKELQDEYLRLLREQGTEMELHSTNADRWKLSLLHSGNAANRRSAYLDYDSGGAHGHNDGMNIGLYAYGMNFFPDLGTPPGHRGGGWYSRYFYWYRSAGSHNTVIVDKKEHRDFCYVQRDIKGGQGIVSESGKSVLWADASWVKAAGADDPLIIGDNMERFERTLAIVDVSEKDCYFFDVFRVKGGSDHTKLTKSFICEMDTNVPSYKPLAADYDPYGMFFINDRNPAENFEYSADDKVKFVRDTMIAVGAPDSFCADFRYTGKYDKALGLPEGRKMSMRYYDLTKDADIITFTSFMDSYGLAVSKDRDLKIEFDRFPEEMMPGVAINRRNDDKKELESLFIGVYEPVDNGSYFVKEVKRLAVDGGDANKGAAAFTVATKYGTDLIIAGDVKDKKTVVQKDWGVKTDAAICILRKNADGGRKLVMMQGSFFEMGSISIKLDAVKDVYETEL